MALPQDIGKTIIKAVENQIDAEIEKLETLDISELENIRKERLAKMKQENEEKKEWLANVSKGVFSRLFCSKSALRVLEVQSERNCYSSRQSFHFICQFSYDFIFHYDTIFQGHGQYTEIEEAEFFNVTKKSKNVIAHFYKNDSERSKIFDHHLKILAPRHLEVKIVKLDAEKAPFLASKFAFRI